MVAEDFLGHKIKEGDEVVFIETGYHNLKQGFVEKVTPQKVRIVKERLNPGNLKSRSADVTYRYHAEVIII